MEFIENIFKALSQAKSIRDLPIIIAVLLTRSTRQRVVVGQDFEWSSRSWTHNVFRVYELIFGRRFGIRKEMSARFWRDARGEHVAYFCHSWESVFALTEQYIREALASLKPAPVRIWIPLMRTPEGVILPASPFLFAIATDTTSVQTSPVSTFSFTCTGSNLKLFTANTGDVSATDNITAMSYNSVALTKIADKQKPSDRILDLWYLDSPATGAHTMSQTASGTYHDCLVASYTGCASGIDSQNTATASSTTTFTFSTTVVASNCWLVASAGNDGGANTAGTGTTLRADGGGSGTSLCDSNGTVGTGSQSLQLSRSTRQWAAVIVSIKPGTQAAATTGFFFFMPGMGQGPK